MKKLVGYSIIAAIYLITAIWLYYVGDMTETGLTGWAIAAYFMVLYGLERGKNE